MLFLNTRYFSLSSFSYRSRSSFFYFFYRKYWSENVKQSVIPKCSVSPIFVSIVFYSFLFSVCFIKMIYFLCVFIFQQLNLSSTYNYIQIKSFKLKSQRRIFHTPSPVINSISIARFATDWHNITTRTFHILPTPTC